MGHYNEDGFYVFAEVTATDKAGILWVATILSLMYSFVTLGLRYYIRKRTFGIDDWLITAATVAALGQYISLFVGMDNYSLGKSSDILTSSEAVGAGRSVFASNCLFIIAMGLSKFSVVYFLKRLFTRDNRVAWLVCNILVGVVAVWVVASIPILTVGCGPATKVVGSRCHGQLLRWSVVAALDALFELVIIVLSIVLVWPLQMPLDIKLTVFLAFFFRIFVAVFAGIHVARIASYVTSPDPGTSVIYNLVWQQIELGYSLIAATIPTLKSFIRGYEKAMGWAESYTNTASQGNPGMFGTASIQLKSFRSKQSTSRSRDREVAKDQRIRSPDDTIITELRPDQQHKYKVNAYGPRHENGQKIRRERSTSSAESQNPIIRKDVDFTISSETAPASPWSDVHNR